jgi:hypothetical protein
LNIHSESDFGRIELHRAEPLYLFAVVLVWNCYWRVEKYKSPGCDRSLAEPIQAISATLVFTICKHTTFIWNKEELPDQWEEPIIVRI